MESITKHSHEYARQIKKYYNTMQDVKDKHHMPDGIIGMIEEEKLRKRNDEYNFETTNALD